MRGPGDVRAMDKLVAAQASATPWQQLTLLLVEDDRADALLVEELIADLDADIGLTWAPSVADAEEELARGRPDCVLLDLHLPDADGIGALHRIADM